MTFSGGYGKIDSDVDVIKSWVGRGALAGARIQSAFSVNAAVTNANAPVTNTNASLATSNNDHSTTSEPTSTTIANATQNQRAQLMLI